VGDSQTARRKRAFPYSFVLFAVSFSVSQAMCFWICQDFLLSSSSSVNAAAQILRSSWR
jgi:hypothetical protein